MDKYIQQNDFTVFGVQVNTFPIGIKEAFGSLMKVVGSNRAYYGLSWFNDDGSIQYYAMSPETFEGEAAQYDYETLTIAKGEYVTITIADWMSKVECIKDAFHELMANNRPSINYPCIEWYKADDEVVCMIKAS